jgi:transposase
MDIISAYREAGTYRGAAAISGTTHKTVKRVIAQHEAGGAAPARLPRGRNYDGVAALVAERVEKTAGRISAKRLLPAARAAGYAGSPRNFRRLVAAQKQLWRRDHHRGRRPAVWSPGEHLVIDWGAEGGLHVFCAVLAWSRVRFVRFASDERAETTLAMLAECFEALGGVPGKVLADRMGCLKGGVVANVVVPTAGYVRFAGHYGFRPDFCEAADPESKGIVENLVGYAKADLMVPQAPFGDLVRRGQRRGAQRDLRGPRGADADRAGAAGPAAVAAGQHRQDDHPQGRPAVLRPFRLGSLLRARPPDRHRSQAAGRRQPAAGDHDRDRGGRG